MVRAARGQGTGRSSWRARVSSSRCVSMRAVRPLGLSAATVTPPMRAWKTCRAVDREPWVRVRPSNEAARWQLPGSARLSGSRSWGECALASRRPAAPGSVRVGPRSRSRLRAPSARTHSVSSQRPIAQGRPEAWVTVRTPGAATVRAIGSASGQSGRIRNSMSPSSVGLRAIGSRAARLTRWRSAPGRSPLQEISTGRGPSRRGVGGACPPRGACGGAPRPPDGPSTGRAPSRGRGHASARRPRPPRERRGPRSLAVVGGAAPGGAAPPT